MTPNTRNVPRLALSKKESAEALGISVDHLERHVLPELRVAYIGSRRLIPVAELQRYLADNAHRVLDRLTSTEPPGSPTTESQHSDR